MSSSGYRRPCEDRTCRAAIEIPWRALDGVKAWEHEQLVQELARDRGWQVVGGFRCPVHTTTGPARQADPVTGGTPHAHTQQEHSTP